MAADPAAFAKAINAYTSIAPTIAERIAAGIKLGAVLSLDQLQRQAAAFHKLGVIQRDVSADLPNHFAGDLVAGVLARG